MSKGVKEFPRKSNYVKVCISVPKELHKAVEEIVRLSKKTTKPITTSAFYSAAVAEYLSACAHVAEKRIAEQESQKDPKEEC